MENILENRLRRLQIRCRRPVEHLLAGEYRSIFKGRGVEFDELREYQPGDDVRSIDWRSVARTGKPFIRRYIEEREQAFILAIDLSASGDFGSGERKKRDCAQEIAALLAYSASANNDRVGLLLFSETVEQFIPPARGRRHVLQAIDALIKFEAQGTGTNITEAIEFLQRVSRKRSIVFLISDFFDTGYGEALKTLSARHDVTTVRIRDVAESNPPKAGMIQLHDAEQGTDRLIDTSAARKTEVKTDELIQILSEAELDGFDVRPDSDIVEALSGYFKSRHQRIVDETGG